MSGSPRSPSPDATSVYFTTRTNPGNVSKVSKSGGAPTPLASETFPSDIVVDGTTLYWDNGGAVAASGQIWRMANDGSGQTELASGQDVPTALAQDATSIY